MQTAKLKGFAAFLAILGVTALSACGRNADTAPVVASAIAITSPVGSIAVDGTMQFVATVTDANGNTLTTAPTWTLVNGGGAITAGGLFTAGDSIGTFVNSIVATIGSVSSASTVSVSAGGLSSIAVTPGTLSLPIGETQQYVAVGHDAHGHVVDIPSRVWSVSAAGGLIDTSGMFTSGTVAGIFTNTVTATSGAIHGSATVTVSAAALSTITITPLTTTLAQGATQQFAAVGTDSYANVVAIEPTWAATLGGTIDVHGLFTAGTTAGTFTNTVSATSGLISGAASVAVNPGPLATMVVSPANTSVFAFTNVQYSVVGKDAGGNVITVAPVWSVSNAMAGSISPTGLFSASSTIGSYTNAIVATSDAVVGTTSVSVMPMIIIPICPIPPYCGLIPPP